MAEVRSLDAFRKASKKKAAAGKSLCLNGHHRWATDTSTSFDSQQGKLVTRSLCERCGYSRVTSQ
jgi:hypothetical protein